MKKLRILMVFTVIVLLLVTMASASFAEEAIPTGGIVSVATNTLIETIANSIAIALAALISAFLLWLRSKIRRITLNAALDEMEKALRERSAHCNRILWTG